MQNIFITTAKAAFSLQPSGSVPNTQSSVSISESISSISTNLIEVLLVVAGALAVLYIIWSGIKFITASGNNEQVKQAKTGIINAGIGVVVVVAAFFIVRVAANVGKEVACIDLNKSDSSTKCVAKKSINPVVTNSANSDESTVMDLPGSEINNGSSIVGTTTLAAHSCGDESITASYNNFEIGLNNLFIIQSAKAANASCRITSLRIPDPHTRLGLENHIIPPLLEGGKHFVTSNGNSRPYHPYKKDYSPYSNTNQSGDCNTNNWECQVSLCTLQRKCNPRDELFYVAENWPRVNGSIWPYKAKKVVVHSVDTGMNVVASILDSGPGVDAKSKGIYAGASAEVFTRLKLANKEAAYDTDRQNNRNVIDMCFLSDIRNENEYQPGDYWHSTKSPC